MGGLLTKLNRLIIEGTVSFGVEVGVGRQSLIHIVEPPSFKPVVYIRYRDKVAKDLGGK